MGIPIRELATRFTFETDEQGLRAFDAIMGGIQAKVLKIAAVLGVGAAATAMARWGLSLETAGKRAALLTDNLVDLSKPADPRPINELATAWTNVQKALAGTKMPNLAQFFQGLAEFRQFNKSGTIQDFMTLFEGASLLATATSQNISATFKQLLAAAKSGDFSILAETIPNFDALDANLQEFIRNLRNVDPTNVQNVRNNFEQILGILRQNQPGLTQMAQGIRETGEGEFDALLQNLTNLGTRIGKNLTGPITTALREVNKFIEEVNNSTDLVNGFLDAIEKRFPGTRDLIEQLSDNFKELAGWITTAVDAIRWLGSWFAPSPQERKWLGPKGVPINPKTGMPFDFDVQPQSFSPGGGSDSSVHINQVNITVPGAADPRGTADEVMRRFVKAAGIRFPQVETA
jgi:methyl-accepting chemotaxis protein